MGLNCGVIGLPNVGKSTLFQALTTVPVEAANYPFCTIGPNVGIVTVCDSRLKKISRYIRPKKTVPTTVEFVDIAGLVKGASKGEGFGNQFLGHIREVHALVHVVRCFEDSDIVHVNGKVDPACDISIINTELALADLETVERRLNRLPKEIKSQDKEISSRAKAQIPVLEKIREGLERGIGVREQSLNLDEKEMVSEFNLITAKHVIYICNVDEKNIAGDNLHVQAVEKMAKDAKVIRVCGKLESEIAALETLEEREEFIKLSAIGESSLEKLIYTAYKILGVETYFTAGEKEVRAWTFTKGMKAPQAAGIIHSDFERGFIRAEVYHCEDLFDLKSEQKIKEMGKMRIEGKNYIVGDGDIIHFRFNV